jgi:hypothetical protein
MPASVDRSDVLELQFVNPRARTPEALAASAARAMRHRPPPDRARYPQGTPPVVRALAELRWSQPHVAEAFDEASLRASAAGKGWGCRWCLAELVASAHGLPSPSNTPQARALLGPECPKCPTSWTVNVYRRLQRQRPSAAEVADGQFAARRAVRMVKAALHSQPGGSR